LLSLGTLHCLWLIATQSTSLWSLLSLALGILQAFKAYRIIPSVIRQHQYTHTHTHTFGGLLSLKETKPVVQFVYPAWQLTYIKNSTNNELDGFSFLNLFSSAKNSILFVFIFWISNIPDHQTPTWVRFPYIFILQYLQ
jgi:hypothetical protein